MLQLKTAPAAEPVLNTDVQVYLRLDSTEYNAALSNYAIMARRQAEEYTRRAFITQTWYLMLDIDEISDVIQIPRPPLQSATVTCYDDAGAGSLQAAANYTVDTYSEPGRIFLNPGNIWGYSRERNGMLIEFIAGYGPAASNVPVDICMAIQEAAALYFNSGEVGELPVKVRERLDPYRVRPFIK